MPTPRDPLVRAAQASARPAAVAPRPFVHLRVHSAYSLLEGALKIPALADLCTRHAMPAINYPELTKLQKLAIFLIVQGPETAAELLRQFEDAEIEGKVPRNPVKVKRGELPAKLDADPEWRAQATYTVSEVERLIAKVERDGAASLSQSERDFLDRMSVN